MMSSSLIIKIHLLDEKSPSLLLHLAARENTKMHTAFGRIESLRVLENRSRISYFTEDNVVFCGKCAISVLRGEAENIYRLSGR